MLKKIRESLIRNYLFCTLLAYKHTAHLGFSEAESFYPPVVESLRFPTGFHYAQSFSIRMVFHAKSRACILSHRFFFVLK